MLPIIVFGSLFSAILMNTVFIFYTLNQRKNGFRISLGNLGTISQLDNTKVANSYGNIFFIYSVCEFLLAVSLYYGNFFENNNLFPILLAVPGFLGLLAAKAITTKRSPKFHLALAIVGISCACIAGIMVNFLLPKSLPDGYRYLYYTLDLMVLAPVIYGFIRFKTLPAFYEYIFFTGALVWKLLLIPVLIVYF